VLPTVAERLSAVLFSAGFVVLSRVRRFVFVHAVRTGVLSAAGWLSSKATSYGDPSPGI
jgi:hypothetical protein